MKEPLLHLLPENPRTPQQDISWRLLQELEFYQTAYQHACESNEHYHQEVLAYKDLFDQAMRLVDDQQNHIEILKELLSLNLRSKS